MTKVQEQRDIKEPMQIVAKPAQTADYNPVDSRVERDKDRKPVKGMFKFYELNGGFLEFCFRKYKEDPIEKYCLYDGQVYTLPLGVATHLNTNGWSPVHAYYKGEDEKYVVKVAEKKRRFGFNPLEFSGEPSLNQVGMPLVTAEYVPSTLKTSQM